MERVSGSFFFTLEAAPVSSLKNASSSSLGKKNDANYHSKMNAMDFEEWWECHLLPNLPAGAVIVMDNASYHTRVTNET